MTTTMTTTGNSAAHLINGLLLLGLAFGSSLTAAKTKTDVLKKLNLPPGLKINFFAKDVEDARSLAVSDGGIVFVGTRGNDEVYALLDKNDDGVAEEKIVLAQDLNNPNGVAYFEKDLYVAEVTQIRKFENIEEQILNKKFHSKIIYKGLPDETHHGWRYIRIGKDRKLYIGLGAPCNVCEPDRSLGTISRMNLDGTGFEIYAKGVRNSVGFDWHPKTGELWFTDNGRDWLGDNRPSCELNRATARGQDFGFPYCHQGDLKDPEFGDKRSCSEFVRPARNLDAHVAPLGMRFYSANLLGEKFSNQALIAEHGSWNRTEKIGYRVMMAGAQIDEIDAEKESGVRRKKPDSKRKEARPTYETFIDGWLTDKKVYGRPVDIEILKDGSVLISDDFNDAIYRVYK